MPRLFLVAAGQDTGGWNWRVRQALARYAPEWEARAMAATRTFLDYPVDLPWRRAVAREQYAVADVVHHRNDHAAWRLYDDGAGKPGVLQYHGTAYRAGHQQQSAEARRIGFVELASTLDLTMLEPGVEWVPVPYDLAALAVLRSEHYRPTEGVVRIAHAPTSRKVKGTEQFLAICESLRRRGHRVEVVLIEQQPHERCLRLKATADIYYDQMELGYGCNAVEAWGMGMPVIAGVADVRVRARMLATWGRYPFAFAGPATLPRVIEQLVMSPAARAEYAQAGHEHAERWHAEARIADLLAEIYRAAPPTLPGPVSGRPATRKDRAQRAAERSERQRRALERALDRSTIRAARRAARSA